MFKLNLEKAEEAEIKLPTSVESLKKQENSRKTSVSALLTMPKALTVWITINCGKFLKRWEYHLSEYLKEYLTCLPRNLYAGQEAMELDMEKWTGSKLEKEYVKALYFHPVYLTSMQSTSCEMPGWMKHKLE